MLALPSIAFFLAPAQQLDILRYFTPARIFSVVLILFGTWLLIRYAVKLLNTIGTRGPRARFVVKLIEPALRITLWFAAIFISFQMLTW